MSIALVGGGYVWRTAGGWQRMEWIADAPTIVGTFACFGRATAPQSATHSAKSDPGKGQRGHQRAGQ